MIKSILVPVTGSAADDAALDTAYLLARPFEAHIECLHAAADWASVAAHAVAESPSRGQIRSDKDEGEAPASPAQRRIDSFCERWGLSSNGNAKPHDVTVASRTGVFDSIDSILQEARYHELIVLGRMPGMRGIESLFMRVGRPVLLAPKQAPENIVPTIAVAWKNSAESARALSVAASLLTKASKIFVLTIEEGKGQTSAASAKRIAELLRRHCPTVETRCIGASERPAADVIVEAAIGHRADLLVMGCYGHSRLREFVLGGMTRDIVQNCPLPVFLVH